MSAITAKASRKMKKYAVLTREPRCFLGSFDFSWEQRKLSEITDKVTEKNAGLQYVETFTNSAEFGIISQRDFFDHDIAKLGSLDGYYIVKNEDFVYNPRISTSAPVGPINRNKLGRTGVMSPLYTVFRPHDIDTTYLEYFFKCGYWHSFMNFNGDSGARSDRFSIRDNVFFQMPIPIPDIDEQKKIGELLTCLDNLITLHQRKCVFLFGFFQAFISMIFTASTFSWEQRKVQDVADRFDNLRIPVAANLRVHGTTPYYGANGIQDYVEGFTHDGEFVLVAEDGANDLKNYPVKCVNGRIWVNNHAHVLQGKAGISDNSFLAFAISQSDIESLLVGGSRAKLNAETLMSIEFKLPCLQEQYRIGEYLTQLDNLITLHQRECISFTARAGGLILTANKKRNTSSWEQRKLGDVVKEITRNDPESEAPIMMITANNGFIEQSERYAFNNAGESLKKYILLKKGELAYNHGASKLRPYGSCFALTTAENARIPFVYHCFSAENQNAEFMSIELNGAEIENQLRKIVSSGARMDGLLNISFDEYTSVSVLLPGTEEQDRIADFFRHLDNLITLHQRKPFLMKWRTSDANRNQTNRLVL